MPRHKLSYRPWSPAKILAAIHRFQTRAGRWPVTADCTPANRLPYPSTVRARFGTLAEARRQAGMVDGGYEGYGGKRHG